MNVNIYKKEIDLISTYEELLARQPSEDLASKVATALLVNAYVESLSNAARYSFCDPEFSLDLFRSINKYPAPTESVFWIKEAVHEQIIRHLVKSRQSYIQRIFAKMLSNMPWNRRIIFQAKATA